LLFGLDGATFTVLDDLVARGVMPYLGRFMQDGARAPLASTVPPLTPIAWTSMVTGRTPGHHGITGFFQFGGLNSSQIRLSNATQLRADTIWGHVNRHGRRAGSLNFPVHNPAPKINGYVVPGWVTWRWLKRDSHPSDLIDRLKREIPGFDIKELAMQFSEEKKAVAGCAMDNYDPWIDMHVKRERQWFNILRHQMINDPCPLTGIVFDGVDKLQHLLWDFLDPRLEPAKPSAEFLRVREMCRDYFRQIDRYLEEAVDLAGPQTTVIIASDHGFTGTDDVLYINTWLEQQGYLTWKPDTEVVSDDSNELGIGVAFHLVAFDMTKTRAFAAEASTNGIRIVMNNDGRPVRQSEYEAFRRELTDKLLTKCVDPSTGKPLVARVWHREDVFAGPAMEQAADLTLTLHDNGFFSVFRSDAVLKKRPKPLGTHHPDGIFVAKGPGIRHGASLGRAFIVDIAPTAMYAMGLPIPKSFDGRVIEEAFTPEQLAARPPVEEWGVVMNGAAHTEADDLPEDDPEILDRLKALGYIE
jgi:predicted AlkP superfamily phosphohydrolase/phosphomutase